MELLRKMQAWLVLATVTSGTASAFGAGTSRAFRRPRYTRKQTGCRDAMLSYRFFKFAIPTGFWLSLPHGWCDDKASKPCRHFALAPQLVQAKAPMIMKASLTRRRLSLRGLFLSETPCSKEPVAKNSSNHHLSCKAAGFSEATHFQEALASDHGLSGRYSKPR